MATDKYDLHTIDYSVQGWDEIMATDMEKLDDVIPSREIVTLGETVAAYQALYQKAADSKWYKAQADGSKQPAQGLAIEGGDADDEIRIHRMGKITNASWAWATIGAPIYLDASTAGALTQTEPASNAQIVGYAMSSTSMIVMLSHPLEGNAGAVEREVSFCVPGSLATGDKAPWIHMPFAGDVDSVYAVVKTASTSGAITIDILKCTDPTAATPTWTSIFTNKITIDQGERTTETAATPASLNGAQSFGIDDLYRINIDGAGTGAADLTVGMKVTT